VSLEKPDTSRKITQIRLLAPDKDVTSPFNNAMSAMGPMINSMYTTMLDAQIKFYSDTTRTTQMAKITKGYYDALIKTGFTPDQALKIVTSKQLVSSEMNER
jgi:hypothetical protein